MIFKVTMAVLTSGVYCGTGPAAPSERTLPLDTIQPSDEFPHMFVCYVEAAGVDEADAKAKACLAKSKDVQDDPAL